MTIDDDKGYAFVITRQPHHAFDCEWRKGQSLRANGSKVIVAARRLLPETRASREERIMIIRGDFLL